MADTVQHFLECMLPELQYFAQQRIFTEPELRQIVSKRKAFEYKLKSKGAGLEHFLRYVQYEMSLDQLRLVRLELAGVRDVEQLKKHAGLSRVHTIYMRALRRYHHHVDLWLNYIAFCFASRKKRPNAYGTALAKLGRTFARAVQYHPHCEELWVRYALWEYEMNHNVLAARATLQKGLRMNPKSWWLWSEYFALELQYMHKLQERMRIVGIDSKNIAAEVQKEEQEEKKRRAEERELEIDYDELPSSPERDSDGEDEAAPEPFPAHFSCATDAVIDGEIPRIVFASATQSAARDLEWYIRCFEKLRGFTNVDLVRHEILASIKRDFADDPHAARFVVCNTVEGRHAQLEELQKRAKESESAGMWEMVAEFVCDCVEQCEADPDTLQLRTEGLPLPLDGLVEVLERAHDNGARSEHFFEQWAELALALGEEATARRVTALWTAAHASSPCAWLGRARVIERLGGRAGKPCADDVASILQAGLRAVDVCDGEQLWRRLLDVLLRTGLSFSQLQSAIEPLLSAAHVLALGTRGSVYEHLVTTVHTCYGLTCARRVFHSVWNAHDPSESFFLLCAAIEHAHASNNRAGASEQVTAVFERALRDTSPHYDSSSALWLEYARTEYARGNFDKAHSIQWRATKALKHPAAFSEQYQALTS